MAQFALNDAEWESDLARWQAEADFHFERREDFEDAASRAYRPKWFPSAGCYVGTLALPGWDVELSIYRAGYDHDHVYVAYAPVSRAKALLDEARQQAER